MLSTLHHVNAAQINNIIFSYTKNIYHIKRERNKTEQMKYYETIINFLLMRLLTIYSINIAPEFNTVIVSVRVCHWCHVQLQVIQIMISSIYRNLYRINSKSCLIVLNQVFNMENILDWHKPVIKM